MNRIPGAPLVRTITTLFLASLAAVAAGCDDATNFRIDPQLVTDTVEIAIPMAGRDLPTALDIAVLSGEIGGGRFPERTEDAEQFDFALRRRGGELVFVPARALGLVSDAAITRPLAGETFESLKEAPGRDAFIADSAVAVQQGAVFAARSRLVLACPFGQGRQFAKLSPIAVDRQAGLVRLAITTNARCEDPRLVLED
jgi:hypothetical protein